MFTPRQVIQLAILSNLCGINDSRSVSYLSKPFTTDMLFPNFIRGMAYLTGKQFVYDTVTKYYPDYPEIGDEVKDQEYIMTDIAKDFIGLGKNTLNKFRLNPELAKDCIADRGLGYYYITSNRFDLYINWGNSGGKLDSDIKWKYLGVNDFGYKTANDDMIPYFNKTRKISIKQEINEKTVDILPLTEIYYLEGKVGYSHEVVCTK